LVPLLELVLLLLLLLLLLLQLLLLLLLLLAELALDLELCMVLMLLFSVFPTPQWPACHLPSNATACKPRARGNLVPPTLSEASNTLNRL
jgi:hypothetical protein